MRFHAFLVGIILILGVSGCSQNSNYVSQNSDTAASATAYFPISEGKTWNYRYTQSNEINYPLRCYWNGTKTVNGNAVNKYITEFLQSDGSVSSTLEAYFEVTDSYIKWQGSSAQATGEGFTWLSFPVQTGKSWTIMSSPEVKATVNNQVSIGVPAGTFSCYRIDWSAFGFPLLTSQWYAKDVGLIKTESYSYYNGQLSTTTTQELISKNF